MAGNCHSVSLAVCLVATSLLLQLIALSIPGWLVVTMTTEDPTTNQTTVRIYYYALWYLHQCIYINRWDHGLGGAHFVEVESDDPVQKCITKSYAQYSYMAKQKATVDFEMHESFDTNFVLSFSTLTEIAVAWTLSIILAAMVLVSMVTIRHKRAAATMDSNFTPTSKTLIAALTLITISDILSLVHVGRFLQVNVTIGSLQQVSTRVEGHSNVTTRQLHVPVALCVAGCSCVCATISALHILRCLCKNYLANQSRERPDAVIDDLPPRMVPLQPTVTAEEVRTYVGPVMPGYQGYSPVPLNEQSTTV